MCEQLADSPSVVIHVSRHGHLLVQSKDLTTHLNLQESYRVHGNGYTARLECDYPLQYRHNCLWGYTLQQVTLQNILYNYSIYSTVQHVFGPVLHNRPLSTTGFTTASVNIKDHPQTDRLYSDLTIKLLSLSRPL